MAQCFDPDVRRTRSRTVPVLVRIRSLTVKERGYKKRDGCHVATVPGDDKPKVKRLTS